MRKVVAILTIVSALSAAPHMAAAQAGEDAADKEAANIVATQVRDQGYACGEPVNAEAEPGQDGDNVWRLDCKNASYRVRLVPDMAAAIEEID